MGLALLAAEPTTHTLARRRRRDEVEDAPDEAVLFMLRSLLDRVRLCRRLLFWERADETDETDESSSSLLAKDPERRRRRCCCCWEMLFFWRAGGTAASCCFDSFNSTSGDMGGTRSAGISESGLPVRRDLEGLLWFLVAVVAFCDGWRFWREGATKPLLRRGAAAETTIDAFAFSFLSSSSVSLFNTSSRISESLLFSCWR